MLNNLLVKTYLSRLINGDYTREKSIIPNPPTLDPRKATVAAKTSDYTVDISDLKKPTIFNNTGAAGNVTLTLPAVKVGKYKVVRAYCLAAQTIQVKPATGEVVNFNGNAVASKYAQLAGVIGNYIELFCDGYQWVVTKSSGVVTKEA